MVELKVYDDDEEDKLDSANTAVYRRTFLTCHETERATMLAMITEFIDTRTPHYSFLFYCFFLLILGYKR